MSLSPVSQVNVTTHMLQVRYVLKCLDESGLLIHFQKFLTPYSVSSTDLPQLLVNGWILFYLSLNGIMNSVPNAEFVQLLMMHKPKREYIDPLSLSFSCAGRTFLFC